MIEFNQIALTEPEMPIKKTMDAFFYMQTCESGRKKMNSVKKQPSQFHLGLQQPQTYKAKMSLNQISQYDSQVPKKKIKNKTTQNFHVKSEFGIDKGWEQQDQFLSLNKRMLSYNAVKKNALVKTNKKIANKKRKLRNVNMKQTFPDKISTEAREQSEDEMNKIKINLSFKNLIAENTNDQRQKRQEEIKKTIFKKDYRPISSCLTFKNKKNQYISKRSTVTHFNEPALTSGSRNLYTSENRHVGQQKCDKSLRIRGKTQFDQYQNEEGLVVKRIHAKKEYQQEQSQSERQNKNNKYRKLSYQSQNLAKNKNKYQSNRTLKRFEDQNYQNNARNYSQPMIVSSLDMKKNIKQVQFGLIQQQKTPTPLHSYASQIKPSYCPDYNSDANRIISKRLTSKQSFRPKTAHKVTNSKTSLMQKTRKNTTNYQSSHLKQDFTVLSAILKHQSQNVLSGQLHNYLMMSNNGKKNYANLCLNATYENSRKMNKKSINSNKTLHK